MPNSRTHTRPPDVWTLNDLEPDRTRFDKHMETVVMKNGLSVGAAWMHDGRIFSDLTRAHARDLDFYASQFRYVTKGKVTVYSGETLLAEGVNRLRMHKLRSIFAFGRRDGNIGDVREYDQQYLGGLKGKRPDDPAVRAYLLERGENEIYGNDGAWERIDRPDWTAMTDQQIVALGYGLMTWPTLDGRVMLGFPEHVKGT